MAVATPTTDSTIVLVESNRVRQMLADGIGSMALTAAEEFAHSDGLGLCDVKATNIVTFTRAKVGAFVSEVSRLQASLTALDELPDELGEDGQDVRLSLTPAEIIKAIGYDMEYIEGLSFGEIDVADADAYLECLHDGRAFQAQDGLEVTA